MNGAASLPNFAKKLAAMNQASYAQKLPSLRLKTFPWVKLRCNEPSELCAKAAEIVLQNEEKYLELCRESCRKCGEQRQPRRRPTERATYVA